MRRSYSLAFSAVKYAGACYLLYLGLRILFKGAGTSPVSSLKAVGARRAFLEGVLVDLLAVAGALRLLQSPGARAVRARVLSAASGITLVALAAYVALAEPER